MFKLHFITCLLVAVIAKDVHTKGKIDQDIRPNSNFIGNRTISNHSLSDSSQLSITNDGPTIFGSKTVFSVQVKTEFQGLFSYQWGTYLPYKWNVIYSNSSIQHLDANWWESTGSKTCFFIVSQMQKGTKQWTLIGKGKSTVSVQDHLQIYITIVQDNEVAKNGSIFLGISTFTAEIHDPSGYLKESLTSYSWLFNDGTAKETTRNQSINHIYKDKGLYLVQVTVSVTKNGKLYTGDASMYTRVEAKLTGHIIAWNKGVDKPTLPSPERSLPCGQVNFLFKLDDPFHFFQSSNLSFLWNFGDGKEKMGSSQVVHNYSVTGRKQITLHVYGDVSGERYSSFIIKNISLREPIKDLNVKGHLKPKEGVAVRYHVTCKGSSPVSFCWYVTQGNCQLSRGIICSPTKLYHDCQNVIDHTFHRAGDYCMNITVTNTVSSAQKSFRVKVSKLDYPANKHKKSNAVLATVIPIMACVLLLAVVYLGIKTKIRFRERKITRSETATFDFRNSESSLQKQSVLSVSSCHARQSCPFFIDCSRYCSNDDDMEDEQEMQERRKFFSQRNSVDPEGNVNYYGTIQRTLGQEQVCTDDSNSRNEDFSPWTPRKNWSKSV